MKLNCLATAALLVLVVATSSRVSAGELTVPGGAATGRAWTTRDSIPIRYVVSSKIHSVSMGQPDSFPVGISPNGSYFFFIQQHGELACDCVYYELMIFRTADVRDAIARRLRTPTAPLRTVRMSSIAGQAETNLVMTWPRWQDDSHIVFLGTGDRGDKWSVYRYGIGEGQLDRLTPPGQHVLQFDVRGGQVIYNTLERGPLRRNALDIPEGLQGYPVQPLRGSSLDDYLNVDGPRMSLGTYVASGGVTTEVQASTPLKFHDNPALAPSLSPDGRWGVASLLPADQQVPERWRSYTGLELPYAELSGDQKKRVSQLALISMADGSNKIIVDAPVGPGGSTQAIWSPDGAQVMLLNMMMPLDGIASRRDTAYAIVYDIAEGQARAVVPMKENGARVVRAGWLPNGSIIVDRRDAAGKPAPSSIYSRSGLEWRGRPAEAGQTAPLSSGAFQQEGKLPEDLSITLRQGMNEPQRVVGSIGKREVLLTAPDPALNGLDLAPSEIVEWREPGGNMASGLLTTPRKAGQKPLPLVIQVDLGDGAWLSRGFQPDGAGSTAFAAQALAAQGLVVLRLENHLALPGESGHQMVERLRSQPSVNVEKGIVGRIDAAIADLAGRGLIDPARVGLVGFSRTGYQVHYTITHPGKYVPAAAIVADSVTGGYVEDILGSLHGLSVADQYGKSFWEDKELWVREAPGFNADRVETPTLFENNVWFPNEILENVGSYQLNKREYDLLLFQDGGHQLKRPLQRLASMQATVDWMSFWLQGREDPDPAKAAQYRYWRKLRGQRDARWAAQGHPGRPPSFEERAAKQ